MRADQLLHKIDKRLAVLEAISKEHAIETEEQLRELKSDVAAVKTEVGYLKIKIAGVASVASFIISIALKKWGM